MINQEDFTIVEYMGDNGVLAFKDLYLTTALENIDQFQKALVLLSKNSTDAQALEQAHRSIHTLKSKSLMMGYESTGTISKSIEDMLYEAKNNTKPLTPEAVKLLITTGTKLHQSIDAIKETDKEIDLSEDLTTLSGGVA